MIKIFISVRNRLAITKKCIEALKLHSEIGHKIYVYDNATNYRLAEHFQFFHKMFAEKIISQITFTSEDTTFRAFSKASTCNFFGKQHEQDPKKNKYDFLVMLDNDIIVTPGWDRKIKIGWDFVKNKNLKHVKVIGQIPGGIKSRKEIHKITDDMNGAVGVLGGSGLWAVKPNFFTEVGFLDLKMLVGHDKKHDQLYWRKLQASSPGKPYIMGLNQKLGIHCGRVAGSVCNKLTGNKRNPKRLDMIKFEGPEKNIDSQDFETFYNKIKNDQRYIRDW